MPKINRTRNQIMDIQNLTENLRNDKKQNKKKKLRNYSYYRFERRAMIGNKTCVFDASIKT